MLYLRKGNNMKNMLILMFAVIAFYLCIMSSMAYNSGDTVAMVTFYVSMTYLMVVFYANSPFYRRRKNGKRKNL